MTWGKEEKGRGPERWGVPWIGDFWFAGICQVSGQEAGDYELRLLDLVQKLLLWCQQGCHSHPPCAALQPGGGRVPAIACHPQQICKPLNVMRKQLLNPEIERPQAIIRDFSPCFLYFLMLKFGRFFPFATGWEILVLRWESTHTHPHTGSLMLSCLQWKQWFWHRKEPNLQTTGIWPWTDCICSGQVRTGEGRMRFTSWKGGASVSENNSPGSPMNMAGFYPKTKWSGPVKAE